MGSDFPSANGPREKVTFVIPAHNEEKTIAPCLQALIEDIKRTGVQAQILVVDNASDDFTGMIAREFPGVQVIEEPRKGIVFARRAGFLRAEHELVANIDADTRLPRGWLRKVIREFAGDRHLVCLSGPFIYYDLSFWKNQIVRLFYGAAFLIYLLNRHVLKVGSMVQGGNFVFKKGVFAKTGGFDTSIAFYGEDTDIARRLHPLGKVKFTFGLPMYASGRRLLKEGIVRTGFRYAVNFLWVSFAGKPRDKTYADIRL
jgi:cellulose synthase/poly-beta-1,6-N-acetylglucosamine synthase-like glycosyltransferase